VEILPIPSKFSELAPELATMIKESFFKVDSLTKQEHTLLLSSFECKANSLTYLWLIQIIRLFVVAMNTYGTTLSNKLDLILRGKYTFTLRRNVGELKTCEPLYQWALICSSDELNLIFPQKISGLHVLQYYNRQAAAWKKNRITEKEAFSDLINIVADLPEYVLKEVHSRLGLMHRLQRDPLWKKYWYTTVNGEVTSKRKRFSYSSFLKLLHESDNAQSVNPLTLVMQYSQVEINHLSARKRLFAYSILNNKFSFSFNPDFKKTDMFTNMQAFCLDNKDERFRIYWNVTTERLDFT
jgi:hypothetical protein